MRVFRVKLECSAADPRWIVGCFGAREGGLPSWPGDYWVQACSNTSWRVVRALSSLSVVSSSIFDVRGKGKRLVALALVIAVVIALRFALSILSCA